MHILLTQIRNKITIKCACSTYSCCSSGNSSSYCPRQNHSLKRIKIRWKHNNNSQSTNFLIKSCWKCALFESWKKYPWVKTTYRTRAILGRSRFEAALIYHYVPKSPIGYDDINFVNFRFSKFFLAQIHLEILHFHRLGLKSFDFVGKCIIYLPKVSLKHPFF